ncbi:MAG: hypothetical protein ACE5HJ_05835 [Thermoplasmata archaeon]
MEESSVTASAIINFAQKLEDSSMSFYSRLAESFAENKEMFLSFADESKKIKVQVVRTYQETISDALEAGFSFKGLDLSEYAVDVALPEEVSHSDVLKMAVRLEENASKFYTDVADRSRSLLATIPRAFSKAAERRSSRRLVLMSLLDEA